MIDFHSHILPGIDDGSKSVAMSVEMLKKSYDCGIDTMVATPHFYIRHNNVENFLAKRQQSAESLMDALKSRQLVMGSNVPKIVYGAEVYYFGSIGNFDNLKELTIGGTNYMLLEMPFVRWNSKVLSDVEKIIDNQGITPIIAHMERYIDANKGTTYINDLLSLDVIVQMNGEFFNSFFTRKKAVELLKSGVVRLLGSDCHNMDKRQPNLDKTFGIIRKKCGQNILDEMDSLGRKILDSAYH